MKSFFILCQEWTCISSAFPPQWNYSATCLSCWGRLTQIYPKFITQPVKEKVFWLFIYIIFWRTKADGSIQWAMTKHAVDYLEHVFKHTPYFSMAPEVIFCGILASLPRSLWEQGKSKLAIHFLTNCKMLTIHFLTNYKMQTETLALLSKVSGAEAVTNTNITSPLFL